MSSLPVRDEQYVFYIGLGDSLNPDDFLAAPTIAAGDFQRSIDDGTFTNLDTLPVVTPTGSVMVKITLSTLEMSGEKVNVVGIDQTDPSEWQDIIISIDVPTGSVETLTDLAQGDITETSTQSITKKAGTEDIILDKTITGSLLQNNVIITTKDTP